MTDEELDGWVLDAMKGVAQADSIPTIYGEVRRERMVETAPYVRTPTLATMIVKALTRLEKAFLIERLPTETDSRVGMIISARYRVLNLLESIAKAAQ